MLLRRGAAINAANKHGTTPLHIAAAYGRTAAITQLVAEGATVDATNCLGVTPLHTACLRGRTSAMIELVRLGADVTLVSDHLGFSALHFAAFSDHLEAVQVLFDAGCTPASVSAAGETPCGLAVRCGQVRCAAAIAANLEGGCRWCGAGARVYTCVC